MKMFGHVYLFNTCRQIPALHLHLLTFIVSQGDHSEP